MSQSDSDLENPPIDSIHNHHHPRYKNIVTFLQNAIEQRRFDSGKREYHASKITIYTTIAYTFPWLMLTLQLIWTSIVVIMSYFMRKSSLYSTLSKGFWKTSLTVSSSVAYGVGWALFVLLGFYMEEASTRCTTSLFNLNKIESYLLMLARQILQLVPSEYWHQGDMKRIAAHLIAYPIALKMTLRGERDPNQFSDILHPDDLEDVIHSHSMHIHCLRVIKTYFSLIEDDGNKPLKTHPEIKNLADFGSKSHVLNLFTTIDQTAYALERIATYRPPIGYMNHMRVFLYIWLFFIPLVLVKHDGWFTFLWSFLITYGVGMIYKIAQALDEPFGFDLQDIKLTQICAKASLRILDTFYVKKMSFKQVVKGDHTTPLWLEEESEYHKDIGHWHPPAIPSKTPIVSNPLIYFKRLIITLYDRFRTKSVIIPLFIYTAWVLFTVFLTWGIVTKGILPVEKQGIIHFVIRAGDDSSSESCRWWCLYLPGDSSTTEFVSLGLFMLLAFWIFDAYNRYWTGLGIWNNEIRTNLKLTAFHFSSICKLGGWHQRDRQRIFSYLAALPYVAKLHLRDSRDLSEVEDILAPEDYIDLSEAEHMPSRIFDVLYGYYNSLDGAYSEVLEQQLNSCSALLWSTSNSILALESGIRQCEAIRIHPISKSYTHHLQIFTGMWLAILPISVIEHDGFLTILYTILIGYSIINLLAMGSELADPFGTDPDDIPLTKFCDEMKLLIYQTYFQMQGGLDFFVREEQYSRESFEPTLKEISEDESDDLGKKRSTKSRTMTLRESLRTILKKFPAVPVTAQLLCTIWTFIAVVLTRALSYTWGEERRTECRFWCSPIDVDIHVLGYTGFALFTILNFRAYTSLERYEEGGKTFCDLERHLRTMAMEFVQGAREGLWHLNDKERIIAHIMQIPFEFRDRLLGIKREEATEKTGLLCENDYQQMRQSPDSITHCFELLESYIIAGTNPDREYYGLRHSEETFSYFNSIYLAFHAAEARGVIATALGIKRYPVVRNYIKHQQIFTGLWLFLLPLGITASSGYFTLIVVPLISYGVLGLETLSTQLLDPYGEDEVDVPVNDLCEEASTSILEAVSNAEWGDKEYIIESIPRNVPVRGRVIDTEGVRGKYQLPHLVQQPDGKSEVILESPREFELHLPHPQYATQNLFAHFVQSVPWWSILATTVWTIFAIGISYLWREDKSHDEVRWWTSNITISSTVATHLGFGTFLLLGFFTKSTLKRYLKAGKNWAGPLGSSLHVISAYIKNYFPEESWHDEDHRRVFGYLASIPLVLKAELRHSMDLTALKGLLSPHDIGKIQCAEGMTKYCIDVVRSYFLRALCHPQSNKDPSLTPTGFGTYQFGLELANLDKIVSECLFISHFDISPAGLILLRLLLGIWFFLMPFVEAENGGWLSVLWMALISYGLLGVYKVAEELHYPYGFDLNDLKLDEMAEEIVRDILYIHKMYQGGYDALVYKKGQSKNTSGEYSEKSSFELSTNNKNKSSTRKEKLVSKIWECVQLTVHAVPFWILALAAAWAAIIVTLSWVVSREFPIFNEAKAAAKCSPWWCSALSIDSDVKKYSGYGLFLLLGVRLLDGHSRYMDALAIWKEEVIERLEVAAHRIFENYAVGTWHQGDFERIAGHLMAYALTVAAEVRGEAVGPHRLDDFLSDDDVKLIEKAENKPEYCADVVRGYVLVADRDTRLRCSRFYTLVNTSYTCLLPRAGANCKALQRIQMPFGYVQHLRIFLVIWLMMLPLGLVESSGWYSILWSVIISYSVIGVECWATELADPFGTDLSDIPLAKLCDEAVTVVSEIKRTFQDRRAKRFVVAERGPFYLTDTSESSS